MKINLKQTFAQPKIDFTKAKKFIWTIGRHAFAVIIFLIFIDALIAGFLFYKYIYLAEKGKTSVNTSNIGFNESSYQQVLTQWQTRDQSLQDFLQKNYPNPF